MCGETSLLETPKTTIPAMETLSKQVNKSHQGSSINILESLILAQDERWRRA